MRLFLEIVGGLTCFTIGSVFFFFFMGQFLQSLQERKRRKQKP